MTHRRICTVLLVLAIVLWSVWAGTAKLQIGDYGLIHSLGSAYFLSLLLMTASFLLLLRSDPRARPLLGLHVFVFAMFLILPSMVLESTPRGTFTYLCATCVKSIEQAGEVQPSAVFYLQWPGLHILGAALGRLTDMDTLTIMLWFPVILQLALLAVAALLLRRFLPGPRLFWIAMWLIVLFPPLFGNLFLPMNAAILTVMATLAVVLWSLKHYGHITKAVWVAIVILLAGTTITHALTSLAAFLDLLVVFGVLLLVGVLQGTGRLAAVGARVKRLGEAAKLYVWQPSRRGLGRLPGLVGRFGYEGVIALVVCAVFIVLWQFVGIDTLSYEGGGGGGGGGSISFTNPEAGMEAIRELSYGGSEAHRRVVDLRIVYGAVISLLALGAFIKLALSRRIGARTVIPAAAVVITSLVLMTLSRYGGEMLARVFWYATPWLCMLAAWSLRSRLLTVFLILAMIVSPALLQVFRYGNEIIDYVPPGNIAAAEFATERLPAEKTSLEVAYSKIVWDYELHGEGLHVTINGSPYSGSEYVATAGYWADAMMFFKDKDFGVYDAELVDSGYGRVYANGEGRLYAIQ